MISDWEEQQAELIRAAALAPELDDRLRTKILLEAGSAVRRRTAFRRLAIAASLMLFVGGTSMLAKHLLTPGRQVAESRTNPEPAVTDGSLNDHIDELEQRAKGPIRGGALSFPDLSQ